MEQGYNKQRVHKVSLLATYGIIIFNILKTLIGPSGFSGMQQVVMHSAPIVVLITILYFVRVPDNVKGAFFGAIPTIVMFILFYTQGFSLDRHFILFVPITIIALYFERRLIIIHGIILNAGYILLYIVKPTSILTSTDTLNTFLSILVMLNGALVFLYFLNTWGKELVQQAEQKEHEVSRILNELTHTFEKVEITTDELDTKVIMMSDDVDVTQESSKQITKGMDEITAGVQQQAESVSDINQLVEEIASDVSKAHNISENITKSNDKMMEKVVTGEDKIDNMKSQMSTIDDAIRSAIVTVEDLENSMADIQQFLQVITTISAQTNLLALNASIESARAGEAGKGFAVVAEEIRKLAEDSSMAVKDINTIVSDVTTKAQNAVQTVQQGNSAVDEGGKMIADITIQYSDIKGNFKESNEALSEEIDMIDRINERFKSVHDRISTIASISEEQSASAEEILATVENQNSNINNLKTSIGGIKVLKDDLLTLIHNESVSS